MKQQLTATSLRHAFDRRSVVLGAVQGGIGLLLAARMGYIAVAENERYQQRNPVSSRSGMEAESEDQMRKNGRDGKRRDHRSLALPETTRRIPGTADASW